MGAVARRVIALLGCDPVSGLQQRPFRGGDGRWRVGMRRSRAAPGDCPCSESPQQPSGASFNFSDERDAARVGGGREDDQQPFRPSVMVAFRRRVRDGDEGDDELAGNPTIISYWSIQRHMGYPDRASQAKGRGFESRLPLQAHAIEEARRKAGFFVVEMATIRLLSRDSLCADSRDGRRSDGRATCAACALRSGPSCSAGRSRGAPSVG